MEYIRETLPYGEELVLVDGSEPTSYYGPDPRRTSLQLRREALAAETAPSSKKPAPSGH